MALATAMDVVRASGRSSRRAVIDVGSNTVRLVLFDITASGGLRSVLERKEAPRLGKDTAKDGALSSSAIERGVATLRRFHAAREEWGSPPIVAIATSAVRDAPNASEFVEAVQSETGIELRTISGTDEARYAYLGVASAWELFQDLVYDVGGGSVQLASTREGLLERPVSVPLGALRLTQRFLEHDPPKRREVEELQEHVRKTLRTVDEIRHDRPSRLFGVGGTVRCLARVAIEFRQYPIPRVHGYPLRRRDLEAIEEMLIELPASERRGVPGVGGDRADVIVAGLLVVSEIARWTGLDPIRVSGTGIREGVALEAAGVSLPANAAMLARRSVEAVRATVDFSVDHGEEVRKRALELFDPIADELGWGTDERLALSVAAWMHDSGGAVDLWRHARHSAYLIRNVPISGLDQRGVLLASLVAWLHEGDSPPSEWKHDWSPILRPKDLELARQLGVLLFGAEQLSGLPVRLSVRGEKNKRVLHVLGRPNGDRLPRILERIRRPFRKVLEIEVEPRGG